jgi:hypothetical protein
MNRRRFDPYVNARIRAEAAHEVLIDATEQHLAGRCSEGVLFRVIAHSRAAMNEVRRLERALGIDNGTGDVLALIAAEPQAIGQP